MVCVCVCVRLKEVLLALSIGVIAKDERMEVPVM